MPHLFRRVILNRSALISTLILLSAMFFSLPGFSQTPAGFGNTLVAGSDWMGGQGVTAYWNGSNPDYVLPEPNSYYDPNNTPYGVNVRTGIKWQCVELPTRLYIEKGWHNGFHSAYAYEIYTYAQSDPAEFSVFNNSGSGYVPVPGDLIIHYSVTKDTAGHVSVVDYVDSSYVHTVEQNASSTGRAMYSRSGPNGSILSRSGLNNIQGVVHCLNNNYGGGSDTDIWVNGSVGNGGNGSQGSPYNTLLAAVNRANATQPVTIHIVPGVYSEKISTSKHIHFVTNGSGTVRIGG